MVKLVCTSGSLLIVLLALVSMIVGRRLIFEIWMETGVLEAGSFHGAVVFGVVKSFLAARTAADSTEPNASPDR